MSKFELDKKLSDLSLAEFSEFLLEHVELQSRMCIKFHGLAEGLTLDPESSQTVAIFRYGGIHFNCNYPLNNPPEVKTFQEGGKSYHFLVFLGTLTLTLPFPCMKFTIDARNTGNQNVPVSWGKWVIRNGITTYDTIDSGNIPPSQLTTSYPFYGEGIEVITIGPASADFRMYRFCYTPQQTS